MHAHALGGHIGRYAALGTYFRLDGAVLANNVIREFHLFLITLHTAVRDKSGEKFQSRTDRDALQTNANECNSIEYTPPAEH